MSLARRLGLRVEQGTLLEYLPIEIREELYQYVYRCDFTITHEPKGNGSNARLIFSKGLLNHVFYLPSRVNKTEIKAMLDAIADGVCVEIYLGGYGRIGYNKFMDRVEIGVGNSINSFPLCIEFIEVLRIISQD